MPRRSDGLQFSEDAARGLRSWTNESFPIHKADADEAPQQMEQADFSVSITDVVAAPATDCLSRDCSSSPCTCGDCDFASNAH